VCPDSAHKPTHPRPASHSDRLSSASESVLPDKTCAQVAGYVSCGGGASALIARHNAMVGSSENPPGSLGLSAGAAAAAPGRLTASEDDAGRSAELVGMHCLQGLSQEGPLEGFASPTHTQVAAAAAALFSGASAAAGKDSKKSRSAGGVVSTTLPAAAAAGGIGIGAPPQRLDLLLLAAGGVADGPGGRGGGGGGHAGGVSDGEDCYNPDHDQACDDEDDGRSSAAAASSVCEDDTALLDGGEQAGDGEGGGSGGVEVGDEEAAQYMIELLEAPPSLQELMRALVGSWVGGSSQDGGWPNGVKRGLKQPRSASAGAAPGSLSILPWVVEPGFA
jgi:hypothetical protein